MEERIRRSAAFWRGVAGFTMFLGAIGAGVSAYFVSGGGSWDFNGGVFAAVFLGSLLALLLSLGVFFMLSRMMDGVAELIRLGGGTASGTGGTAAPAPRIRHVSEPGTNLLDGPGGHVVTRLPGGTALTEVDRQGDYILVKTSNGQTGWLERRSVF